MGADRPTTSRLIPVPSSAKHQLSTSRRTPHLCRASLAKSIGWKSNGRLTTERLTAGPVRAGFRVLGDDLVTFLSGAEDHIDEYAVWGEVGKEGVAATTWVVALKAILGAGRRARKDFDPIRLGRFILQNDSYPAVASNLGAYARRCPTPIAGRHQECGNQQHEFGCVTRGSDQYSIHGLFQNETRAPNASGFAAALSQFARAARFRIAPAAAARC